MALTANFAIRRDPMAKENCQNKESLSIIRKIAVKGIAVKGSGPSIANLVHVITKSIVQLASLYVSEG